MGDTSKPIIVWAKLLWAGLILLCISIIFFVIGYIIGVNSVEPGCSSSPLVYGIRQLEKENRINFSCSCVSSEGHYFFLNSTGMYDSKLPLPIW